MDGNTRRSDAEGSVIVELCPFCLGDEQDLIRRSGPFMPLNFRVECDCGACGPKRDTEWAAITAWNQPQEALREARARRLAA